MSRSNKAWTSVIIVVLAALGLMWFSRHLPPRGPKRSLPDPQVGSILPKDRWALLGAMLAVDGEARAAEARPTPGSSAGAGFAAGAGNAP